MKEKEQKINKIVISIRIKVVLTVLFFSALFFVSALLFASSVNKSLALVSIVKNNYGLARSLAVTLDQDYVTKTLYETGKKYESLREKYGNEVNSGEYLKEFDSLKDKKYEELQERLEQVEEENGLCWINIHLEYPDTGKSCIMIDTDIKEDRRYAMGWEGRIRDWKALYSLPYEVVYDDYDGFIIMTEAPFYRPGSDKKEIAGYIAIAEKWMKLTNDNLKFAGIFGGILLLISLIFVTVSVKGMSRLVIRPLRSLAGAAREFRLKEDKRNESHIFSDLNIRSKDELQLLADSMSDMETDIYKYMRDLEYMARKQERVSAELDMAARIQTKMLPVNLTGFDDRSGFSISAATRPAREVGGDFYDYFAIDEDHIGLTVADVSDKGVPAALFMVVSKTLIKSIAQDTLSPASVLSKVNNRLIPNNDECMFVTAFFGIYSLSERKLRYVNAGHENPVVYRKEKGKYELLKEEHDMLIGVVKDTPYNERTIEFNAGDRLFLYTDGVLDASDESGLTYGTDRLIECLDRNAELPGDAVLKRVMEDLDAFAQDAEQFDDIIMLLFDIDDSGVRQ